MGISAALINCLLFGFLGPQGLSLHTGLQIPLVSKPFVGASAVGQLVCVTSHLLSGYGKTLKALKFLPF